MEVQRCHIARIYAMDVSYVYVYIEEGSCEGNVNSPCISTVSLPLGNWMDEPKPANLTGAELSVVASSEQAGLTSRCMMSFSWQ